MASFWDKILPGASREEAHNMRRAINELSETIGSLSQLPRTGLAEMLDSRTLDYVMRHLGDIRLGMGDSTYGEPDNDQRLAVVRQCRSQFFYDPLLKRIINLWTDFGFGLNFALNANDPEAQKVWDEFLAAKRNRKIIGPKRRHVLSNRLLVDGEFLWLYFVAEKTGLVTARMLMTDEVDAILTVPGDPYIPLYYMREWSPSSLGASEKWLYRDADATPDDLDTLSLSGQDFVMADDKKDGAIVRAMMMEFPALGLRGWPLMAAGADWTQGYKKFAEDRAAISAAAAMFYRKVKTKTGSRGVDLVKSKIDSTLARLGYENNPPPVAGSTMLLNDVMDEETMPLHTGASDASQDGAMLIAMAGIAAGVFPHYLGFGEAFRLATACYSADTCFLGENGWKHYWEWSPGERIAAYDHDKRRMVYIAPTALHVYPYEGEMVALKARSIDALVTPNHRMLIQKDQHFQGTEQPSWDWEIVRADELPKCCYLPTAAQIVDRQDVSEFILPSAAKLYYGKPQTEPDVVIAMDAWLGFLGWWLAEGSISARKNTNSYATKLTISSDDEAEIASIDAIIGQLPLSFHRYVCEDGTRITWESYSYQLYKWLLKNCGKGAANKRIPSFVFQLNNRQSGLLLETLWQGDGSYHSVGRNYIGSLASISHELLDGAQRIMLQMGEWGAIAAGQIPGEESEGSFRATKPLYWLHRTKQITRSLRSRNVSRVPYEGHVWCFEAPPYGMFITRRNGCPLIAGNTAMETPMLRQWERYQSLWKESWKQMFNFVLDMRQEYANQQFPDRDVAITMDPLREMDLGPFANALALLHREKLIPTPIAMRLGLDAFGVEDVDTILDDQFPSDGQTPAERAERLKMLRVLFTEALNAAGENEGKRASAEIALEEIDKWLQEVKGATE